MKDRVEVSPGDGDLGGTGRHRGKRNCNHHILCEKRNPVLLKVKTNK